LCWLASLLLRPTCLVRIIGAQSEMYLLSCLQGLANLAVQKKLALSGTHGFRLARDGNVRRVCSQADSRRTAQTREELAMTEAWSSKRLGYLVLDVLVGCFFVVANFGGILKRIAGYDEIGRLGLAGVLIWVSQAAKQVFGTSTTTLYGWLTICFVGLWLYLGTLAVLALVRRNFGIAGFGLAGLITGVSSLAVLSWAGMTVWGILWLVGWVFHILMLIARSLSDFLAWLLIHTWPVLVIGASIVLIVFLWKQLGPLRSLMAGAAAAVLYLLGPVFRAFWERILLPVFRWFGWLLGVIFSWLLPLFKWIGFVLAWIFKIVLMVAAVAMSVGAVLGVVGSFGHILVDQMKTAWEAGRSRKGVLIGSFSLGTSLALILLVSAGPSDAQANPIAQSTSLQRSSSLGTKASAKKRDRKISRKKSAAPSPVSVQPTQPPLLAVTVDQAWHKAGWILGSVSLTHAFAATLPHGVLAWAQQTFKTASAPIFDAVIFAFAIVLSVIGALRGLFTQKVMPLEIKFYNRDLLVLAILPILVYGLVVGASDSNQ